MSTFGFVTCVHLGVSALRAFRYFKSEHQLKYIATLPPGISSAKVGRASDFDYIAYENNCPLFYVEHINDLISLEVPNVDYLCVIGWSQIASSSVLSMPLIDCIGAHPTLLPIGRGRAPIPWTIIKGLSQTGLTFFRLSNEADNGDVFYQIPLSIDPHSHTSTLLYSSFIQLHFIGMVEILSRILTGTLDSVQQRDTFDSPWPRRCPSDALIHSGMTIAYVKSLIRAQQYPYPLCYIVDKQDTLVHSYEGMQFPPCESDFILHRLDLVDGSLDLYSKSI